jgi:integrase
MKSQPKPQKSDRIELELLNRHLDSLNLDNENDLNFWLYCKIAMRSGLRSSDIIKMKVDDIRFNERKVLVIEKKTKREVMVPLPSQILDRINQSNDLVLWNSKYSTPLSLMTINRRLKKIYEGTESNVSSHSIRKSVAREIYKKNGNDIVIAMKFLGHKNTSTTIKYLEVDSDELDKCYELLEW